MRYFLLAAVALLSMPALVQAQSVPWNVAVVIYGAVDADCHGTPMRAVTTPIMRANAEAEAREFEALVESWSAAEIQITILDYPLLTRLTPVPGKCWPIPSDIDDYPVGFDSVLVLHPWQIDPTFGAPTAGRAYSGVLPTGTHGVAIIPDGSEWYSNNLAGVMLHEWLHGVQAWFDVEDRIDIDLGSEQTVVSVLITPAMWDAYGTPTHPGDRVIENALPSTPAPVVAPTPQAVPPLPDTTMSP